MMRTAAAAKERVTLNPERERLDSLHCEKLLGDDRIREILESAWYCVLGAGEPLRNEKCPFPLYKKAFTPPCSQFGDSDRTVSIIFRAFDSQHVGDDIIDFIGYVKSLFHLGFERFKTSDYDVATTRMLAEFIEPFIASVRESNNVTGTASDARLMEDPDIDRVLYVFDGVFDRLFHRYRAADDHDNRDLTLEQANILDQFVETLEVRELAKDYGFFPRHLSWVEISIAAQVSCFGRVVRDPSMVGPAFASKIESVASPKSAQELAVAAISVPESQQQPPAPIVNFDSTAVAAASNPLFMPALPPEFLTDEPLLDKARFMACLVRLSQSLYNRPDFVKRLPSTASRLEEMLAHMAPTYERAFARTMESDCDFTERGVPSLLSGSATAALQPSVVPMEGGVDVFIAGSNYGEKRGVFTRFTDRVTGRVQLVRCHEVAKRRVVVRAPPAVPQDLTVELTFTKGQYQAAVARVAKVTVECSNDKLTFSVTDPPQTLTFRKELPNYVMPEDVAARLIKSFVVLCAIGHPYNSKYLTIENWRKAKSLFGITEAGVPPPTAPGAAADATPSTAELTAAAPSQSEGTDTMARGTGGREVFFLLFAQVHESIPGLSLDFKAYLATLARCFLESAKPGQDWRDEFLRISFVEASGKSSQTRPRAGIDAVAKDLLDEASITTAAVAKLEKRSTRELDVFLGPVLCGTLTDRSGSLRSRTEGDLRVVFPAHHAIDYIHYDDVASELVALGHLMSARTFDHAVDRLLSHGFDVACHESDTASRKPVGRCWWVLDPASPGTDGQPSRVGAMWDYTGHMGTVAWQPSPHALHHESVTAICYLSDHSDAFRHIYQSFVRGRGPGEVRDILVARGLKIATRLYKIS